MVSVTQNDFILGDLVKLRSGGPSMTVTHVRKDGFAAHCSWFEGQSLRQEWFMFEALKMAKMPKEKDASDD